ncbi:hypothetical protein F4859DRAFT_462792 [Xylaria cf. heliscus]|nr:hypothetical protein F4859DRAFT_462792 [Xylaria cf. heliscus]
MLLDIGILIATAGLVALRPQEQPHRRLVRRQTKQLIATSEIAGGRFVGPFLVLFRLPQDAAKVVREYPHHISICSDRRREREGEREAAHGTW